MRKTGLYAGVSIASLAAFGTTYAFIATSAPSEVQQPGAPEMTPATARSDQDLTGGVAGEPTSQTVEPTVAVTPQPRARTRAS